MNPNQVCFEDERRTVLCIYRFRKFSFVVICLFVCLFVFNLLMIIFTGVKISVTDEEAAQESSGSVGKLF